MLPKGGVLYGFTGVAIGNPLFQKNISCFVFREFRYLSIGFSVSPSFLVILFINLVEDVKKNNGRSGGGGQGNVPTDLGNLWGALHPLSFDIPCFSRCSNEET